MAFNPELSLYKNIQLGLWANGESIESAAEELGTTPATVRTAIGNRFVRANGKSTPLYKKVFAYLEKQCKGFKSYCKKEKINVDS